MTGYPLDKSLSIHEHCHVAAAWMLGHKVKAVRLGDETAGKHAAAGMTELAPRRLPSAEAIEERTMIVVAGSEGERVWNARHPDAPAGWLERVAAARGHDLDLAKALALAACADDEDNGGGLSRRRAPAGPP